MLYFKRILGEGDADDEIAVDPEAGDTDADDDDESESDPADYNVELEDIVHKPKPKGSSKRKNSKRKKPTILKNKVIFGSVLPISESHISLTGRLNLNQKKVKPQPLLDDELIITQIHNQQLAVSVYHLHKYVLVRVFCVIRRILWVA